MSDRKYHHRKLVDIQEKVYERFPDTVIEFRSVKLSPEDHNLELLPQFESILIPGIIVNLVEDFLNLYPVDSTTISKEKLLTIICGAQNFFISWLEPISEDLTEDFFNEKKERKVMLDLLEEFQFKNRNTFKEVVFKKSNGNFRFKNFFLVADIYRALIEYWDLNVDSEEVFKERKESLLNEPNQIKLKKRETFAKHTIAKGFYNVVKDLKIPEKEKFEIVGVFFNCAQISLVDYLQFNLSPSFSENLSEIVGYQNISNLIKRDTTFLLD